MRSTLSLMAALGATLLTCTAAQALEPFRLYDEFATATLDQGRWNEGERVRIVKAGTLNLMQRTSGLGDSNSGSMFMNFNENVSNPAAVTALKAKITVTALEVNACPANPTVAQSRARINGSFFNVGSPVPGSQVGDVLAQVRIGRFSNSADPAGVLRVQGLAVVCSNADCSTSTLIGAPVELGTVAIGVPVLVQMQWDQPAKRFRFGRDGTTAFGSVAYTQTDASPPSVPFKQLSTRLDLPSCASAPRVSGMVDARFDLIAVNQSAAP